VKPLTDAIDVAAFFLAGNQGPSPCVKLGGSWRAIYAPDDNRPGCLVRDAHPVSCEPRANVRKAGHELGKHGSGSARTAGPVRGLWILGRQSSGRRFCRRSGWRMHLDLQSAQPESDRQGRMYRAQPRQIPRSAQAGPLRRTRTRRQQANRNQGGAMDQTRIRHFARGTVGWALQGLKDGSRSPFGTSCWC